MNVEKQVGLDSALPCFSVEITKEDENLFEGLFYILCIPDLCSGSHCRTRDCSGSTLPRQASWSPLRGYQCNFVFQTWSGGTADKLALCQTRNTGLFIHKEIVNRGLDQSDCLV